MALLATQSPSLGGTVRSYVAASAGGDTMVPDDRAYLSVKNGGGSSITVTITAQTPCNHGSLHDGGGSVAAGAERMFGPISPSRFARSSDGLAAITYSGVTSVTVAAIKS